jgi:NAD+ kinase
LDIFIEGIKYHYCNIKHLKFKIFVHPLRPKVQKEKIQEILYSLDLKISETDPDIGLIIGGDGTFSYYGKKLSIPMLFIGVPTNEILGSKSRLAEISLQNLPKALRRIAKGNYVITERRMLNVRYGTSAVVSALTDVYLERGLFSGCIRYSISITTGSNKIDNKNTDNKSKSTFIDYVIGNGVIISTSFGSSGYYSYLDRIKNPKQKQSELFDDNKLGICHILPTFAKRILSDGVIYKESVPIRYTVPVSSTIEITAIREANIRLYGTTVHSKGVKIAWNKPITVTSSTKTAKIIRLA